MKIDIKSTKINENIRNINETSSGKPSGNIIWKYHLETSSGNITWKHYLEKPSGNIIWKYHLETSSGKTIWKHHLETSSGNIIWKHHLETTQPNRTKTTTKISRKSITINENQRKSTKAVFHMDACFVCCLLWMLVCFA